MNLDLLKIFSAANSAPQVGKEVGGDFVRSVDNIARNKNFENYIRPDNKAKYETRNKVSNNDSASAVNNVRENYKASDSANSKDVNNNISSASNNKNTNDANIVKTKDSQGSIEITNISSKEVSSEVTFKQSLLGIVSNIDLASLDFNADIDPNIVQNIKSDIVDVAKEVTSNITDNTKLALTSQNIDDVINLAKSVDPNIFDAAKFLSGVKVKTVTLDGQEIEGLTENNITNLDFTDEIVNLKDQPIELIVKGENYINDRRLVMNIPKDLKDNINIIGENVEDNNNVVINYIDKKDVKKLQTSPILAQLVSQNNQVENINDDIESFKDIKNQNNLFNQFEQNQNQLKLAGNNVQAQAKNDVNLNAAKESSDGGSDFQENAGDFKVDNNPKINNHNISQNDFAKFNKYLNQVEDVNKNLVSSRIADPKDVIAQIKVNMSKLAGAAGNKTISVQLTPKELGQVDITLEIANQGKTKVVVMAEKADTLNLLQRESSNLKDMLQDALKTDLTSLSFSFQDKSDQNFKQLASNDNNSSNHIPEEEVVEDDVINNYYQTNIVAKGIDIRI